MPRYIPPAPSLPADAVITWNGAIEHDAVIAAQRAPEPILHRSAPQPIPHEARVADTAYLSHKAHYRVLLARLPLGATFTLRTFAPDAGIPKHLITLYSAQAVASGRLQVIAIEPRHGGGGLVQRFAVVALADCGRAPQRLQRRRAVA